MLIGFIGDAHGRAFHVIAAIATLQAHVGERFDLLIQVGDLSTDLELDQRDPASHPHLAADPTEADFARLLRAEGKRAKALHRIREKLASPIHFIRGNHENFSWLHQLTVETTARTARIDPFDLFRYVPDGTVLQCGDLAIALLGGVEEQTDEAAIDQDAYRSLLDLGAGTIDVLITHQGPYGTSVGYHGDIHGSPLMTHLIEHIEPSFHVAGHAHSMHGPRTFGRTTYLGLDGLVAPPKWHPEARGLQPGCLALLDATTASLYPVMDSWLASFPTPFDFDRWVEDFLSQ